MLTATVITDCIFNNTKIKQIIIIYSVKNKIPHVQYDYIFNKHVQKVEIG